MVNVHQLSLYLRRIIVKYVFSTTYVTMFFFCIQQDSVDMDKVLAIVFTYFVVNIPTCDTYTYTIINP